MLGGVTWKTITIREYASIVAADRTEIGLADWNALSTAERKAIVAEANRKGRAAVKAANQAAKRKGTQPRQSSRSGGGTAGEDAFTRQGRMSQSDWRATFYA